MPKKYRYIIATIIVIILGVVAFSIYSIRSLHSREIKPGQEDWISVKGRINILLLGTDEDLGMNSRTDSIILASLDTKNKKVSLLSIPRDTRVNIPGYGDNKINSANQLGGVDLVKESISNLIKVPIDYYVLTNFEGFKGIVDTLGGVEIDVEQDMKYHVYDGMIDLKKGRQRLDGDKALQYVRFRHDKLGDISRTQRQQKFLSSLAQEMIQAKNIIKLPVLIPKLNEAVKTDLNITQMISLAKDFGNYDLSSITVQTLPGNFVNINGGSYWYVDSEKSQQVVLEVFAGKSGDIIDTDLKINGDDDSAQKETKNSTPPKKKPIEKPEENNENEFEIPIEDIPVIIDDNNNSLPEEIPDGLPSDGNDEVMPSPEEPKDDSTDGIEENLPPENQEIDPVSGEDGENSTEEAPDQTPMNPDVPDNTEKNVN